MLDVRQFIFSLLNLLVFRQPEFSPPPPLHVDAIKSIAIVGAGSSGLAILHALVDLQDELDTNLDIVAYEQRRDIGGIWLPDPQPVPHPPVLPETPLYPLLHTNVPIPGMTLPGFPFPPGTALYPSHEYVEKYHQDLALHYNLWPHIALNHTVLSASWVGTPEEGNWDILVEDQDGREIRRSFDHLVVATGHSHYPHVPIFPGQDDWLRHANDESIKRREILHSIFYREPQRYVNQTVVVVGSGASGQDAAAQVAPYAHKVYFSVRSLQFPAPESVEVKPEIAYFTPDDVVFADGSQAHGVDAVILGTGYDIRFPFLETSGEMAVKPTSSERGRGLTTNLRYVFPLHQHIFSLSASYPPNALAFIGLPSLVQYFASGYAQSIYAARAILNGSCIGTREELLQVLDAQEDDLRSRGHDPYYVGHRMVDGSTFDYQENLIDMLKAQGTIPDDGVKYVQPWRRESGSYKALKRGWKRVEELGLEREWLAGVETEAEWADLMRRLDEWQVEWEARQRLTFPDEPKLF